MGEIWGCARVSTDDQNPGLQVDALTAAGVPRKQVVIERISGAARVLPKFVALIERLATATS